MTTATRALVPAVLAGALALAGCGGDEPAGLEGGGATPTQQAETTGAEAEPSGEATGDPTSEARRDARGSDAQGDAPGIEICEPGEGKTVTMLDDVVIPEQEIPAVPEQTVDIDGETVEIPGVDAAVLPERIAEAGCIVEYEAPGGCLGAVEISGARIPPYTIPERVLPEVTLPDGTVLDEVVLPAEGREEVTVEGTRAEEVCQVTDDVEAGEAVSAVSRPAISRRAIGQPAAAQKAAARPTEAVGDAALDGTTVVDGVLIDGVVVDGVVVDGVVVDGAVLDGYVLDGSEDTEIAEKEGETYYTTEGDVLFDVDDATIRPDAESELEAIAADIVEQGEDLSVLVEGHTDNVRSEEHNLDLSRRRAEAVADWLVEHADIARSAVTTEGHGFAYPRTDNSTEEGRAQNRRVVITVTAD
ncbi:hypothetical protein GCM10023169_19180 [Georgenia halophila]|uniref:OmpA-like domain-containing protein n=1 Tax=Georgenia halophila TaxID=620889 RepID=A0ABP8L601_9MICO